MSYLQAIILSMVEGISEFLPISSTGHLVLATNLMHIVQSDFVKSFEIVIQFGAILAVVYVYRKELLQRGAVWKNVIAAFIPTALIGFLLYKFIKHVLLGNTGITLLALLVGGIVLIVLELLYQEKDHHVKTIESIPLKNAVLIGVFQAVAVIPGVSRSAATIIPALFLGIKRKAAVEFSFFLAIPTMLAATSLDLIKSNFSFTSYQYSLMVFGLIGSFIFAMLAIKFFISFIQKHTFILFGVYRIIIAIIFLFIIGQR